MAFDEMFFPLFEAARRPRLQPPAPEAVIPSDGYSEGRLSLKVLIGKGADQSGVEWTMKELDLTAHRISKNPTEKVTDEP